MNQPRLRLPSGMAKLVDRLLGDARGRRPVMILDGGSGAGKTSLADDLVACLGRAAMANVQLVSLDDVYQGWDSLAQTSETLPALLTGSDPGYWGWDWQLDRRTDWHPIDPRAPLLVEGCGALTPATAQCASTTMWLAMAPARRRQRALARDGENYTPHWQRWAAQERQHWRRDRPRELADVVLHWMGGVPGH
ncbi:Uridine kinase [Propionibacterium cyclohexanicum]|uniref:Uridine kinase n=1 Tax=Propionibacterium cyclohexanicum TaxID=64702 RepID=A0A1H9RUP1_9ACTN|nr:cobalt ABC transporter [Propionibacterium cyclohexanicum]SER76367.1 Uridine kinase [Propionibacterium cyclohexanicum]